MSKPAVIALCVVGIAAVAFGAQQLAVAASRRRATGQRGTNVAGGPPPPPTPGSIVDLGPNGATGTIPSGIPVVGGKTYTVDGDGVTVDGTHYSKAEVGLAVVTGGQYGVVKQTFSHPIDTAKDIGHLLGF